MFKVNLFFQQGQNGWSETYYSDVDAYADANDQALKLTSERGYLLGGGAFVKAVRTSDVRIYKDASLLTLTPASIKQQAAWGLADKVHTALYLRLAHKNLYFRGLMLRGVPDDEIQGDDQLNLSTIYRKALEEFGKFLQGKRLQQAGNWVIRCEQKVLDNVEPTIPSIDIQNAAVSDKPTTVVCAAHGLPSAYPTKIHMVGVKGNKAVNGIHMAQGVVNAGVPDPDRFLLLNVAGNGPYEGGGRWWPVRIVYRPITDITILRETHRDTGRPFDLSRGSRKRPQVRPV